VEDTVDITITLAWTATNLMDTEHEAIHTIQLVYPFHHHGEATNNRY